MAIIDMIRLQLYYCAGILISSIINITTQEGSYEGNGPMSYV